ncbi:hypothetical protein [Methylobacterium fujisawaense]|uniref:hypothetical protein n=1 Tax=Methylobacterium fujisawaense TaxID=107400 RepID=UPI002F355B4F
MPRQFPRRRSGAIEGRLSDLVLALTGVLLLGTMILLMLSWLTGDTEGTVPGPVLTQGS